MILNNKQRDFIRWRLGELGHFGEQARFNFDEFLKVNDESNELTRGTKLIIEDTVTVIAEQLDTANVNVPYVEKLTEIALNKIVVANEKVGDERRIAIYNLIRERDFAESQAKGLN